MVTVIQMDTSERWKPKRNATFRLACDDSSKKNIESERWIGKKKIKYLFLFKILPTFRMCDFLKNCRWIRIGTLRFAWVFNVPMLPSIQLSQVARRDVAFGSRFSTFRRSASPDSRSSHSPPRPSRAPKGCTLQIASGDIFPLEFN